MQFQVIYNIRRTSIVKGRAYGMFIWAEVISVSERRFQQVIFFRSVRLEKCYPAHLVKFSVAM